jgi:hypothetical protein
MRFKTIEIPPCLGYVDYYGDYDCEYFTEINCEDCICNYIYGGYINPITGKKFTEKHIKKVFKKEIKEHVQKNEMGDDDW